MRLTKKLKKVITLSVLGTATVVLAGIASTKVIKTELGSEKHGRPDDVDGYLVNAEAEAETSAFSDELNKLELAAKTLEEKASSMQKAATKDTGFVTEPRFS